MDERTYSGIAGTDVGDPIPTAYKQALIFNFLVLKSVSKIFARVWVSVTLILGFWSLSFSG